jgi:hypothetical protein
VVGGGNNAVEAALTLSEQNRVVLSYRGSSFTRVFKDNERKLKEAVERGSIRVFFNSNVRRFEERTVLLDVETVPYDHAFVLIGAEIPTEFLRSLGIKLENDWTGNPWLAAGLAGAALYGLSMYGGTNNAGLVLSVAAVLGLTISGIRGSRFAWLGISFLIAYTIYGAKHSTGNEFWPFRGWGFEALSFFNRPWSFWYTVL